MDIKHITLSCGLFICLYVYKVSGLECYACKDQDSNKDKCIKTTIQCESFQDICQTTVLFSLPPYWVPHGDQRMHHVSKECAVASSCYAKRDTMAIHCKRDWWDDWGCTECCDGDLCNFYVTLGSSSTRCSVFLLTISTLLAVIYVWLG